MTKEEIQKNSEHWYNKYKELEKENRLLGERCNQLLKDKGELTDKVKELEDHLAEEVELHSHAEEYIKSLEKENEKLRNNGFTVSAMTEQQLKVAIEKGEQLEKKNAELKKQIEKMKSCEWQTGEPIKGREIFARNSRNCNLLATYFDGAWRNVWNGAVVDFNKITMWRYTGFKNNGETID